VVTEDKHEALQEEKTQEIPSHLLGGDDRPPSSMLMRLLESGSARRILEAPVEDLGLAEHLPFPFMGLVGQVEMRMALLLTVINPNVGGTLLIGPRGTGKTTAARGLTDLLPFVEHSTCLYGCMPEDYEALGHDGVCEDCAAKLEAGERITRTEPVRLIELPLNARLEDVVGGINERIALQQNRIRLERGLLARADQNLLYVDEANLLDDKIVDAILDAAAQGHYTVRRGPMRATYRSRFVLIGSMNPEEGNLRPQILDRFGLRVVVTGLADPEDRLLVYKRVREFRANPRALIQAFDLDTFYAREDVITARELLSTIELSDKAQKLGLRLVQELGIHSHRAEFTMFEAARAYAAADGREEATVEDLRAVAPMALRMRRSEFIEQFIATQQAKDQEIIDPLDRLREEYS
jgi:magnesium chelatase subunit I